MDLNDVAIFKPLLNFKVLLNLMKRKAVRFFYDDKDVEITFFECELDGIRAEDKHFPFYFEVHIVKCMLNCFDANFSVLVYYLGG